RGRRCFFVLWIVLSSAIGHGLAFAQTSAPRLDVRVDSSNVVFGLSGQSGLFYTWQTSSDLSNWIPHEPIYADSATLSLTESVSGLSATEFVRAKANHPNTTLLTNYATWTHAVLLNNGLVEAVIVPPAGRVLQFR